jgi:hypothetical protein
MKVFAGNVPAFCTREMSVGCRFTKPQSPRSTENFVGRECPPPSLQFLAIFISAWAPSNALPRSSDDQRSAKSRLRVVLTSLTSSSLRSRHGRSTGSFLPLLEVLKRARISGIKGVRIYGTDKWVALSGERWFLERLRCVYSVSPLPIVIELFPIVCRFTFG